MTILHVDDDEDDRFVFKEAIKSLCPSCEFRSAVDGLEASKILSSMSPGPDYIFLDVNMPRMDGREFLKSIRNNKSFNKVPVVMLSTTNNEQEKSEYKKLGAAHFLTKSSSFAVLCTELNSIISRPGSNI